MIQQPHTTYVPEMECLELPVTLIYYRPPKAICVRISQCYFFKIILILQYNTVDVTKIGTLKEVCLTSYAIYLPIGNTSPVSF